MICKVVALIYISSYSAKRFPFPCILTSMCHCLFFNDSYFYWGEMEFQFSLICISLMLEDVEHFEISFFKF
jgi:hypothetical protein